MGIQRGTNRMDLLFRHRLQHHDRNFIHTNYSMVEWTVNSMHLHLNPFMLQKNLDKAAFGNRSSEDRATHLFSFDIHGLTGVLKKKLIYVTSTEKYFCDYCFSRNFEQYKQRIYFSWGNQIKLTNIVFLIDCTIEISKPLILISNTHLPIPQYKPGMQCLSNIN